MFTKINFEIMSIVEIASKCHLRVRAARDKNEFLAIVDESVLNDDKVLKTILINEYMKKYGH